WTPSAGRGTSSPENGGSVGAGAERVTPFGPIVATPGRATPRTSTPRPGRRLDPFAAGPFARELHGLTPYARDFTAEPGRQGHQPPAICVEFRAVHDDLPKLRSHSPPAGVDSLLGPRAGRAAWRSRCGRGPAGPGRGRGPRAGGPRPAPTRGRVRGPPVARG